MGFLIIVFILGIVFSPVLAVLELGCKYGGIGKYDPKHRRHRHHHHHYW